MSTRFRTILIGVAGLMAACGGGNGSPPLDLDCLFCDFGQQPATIFIDAGDDQVVIAEDMVRFASSDYPSAGCHARYSWTQVGGPKADIWAPYPHRSAVITTPMVYTDTMVTFRFTGTCSNGVSKSDDVTVRVQPTSVAALCESAPLYSTSYAWTTNGCVTDPADIAGDTRVATIYRESEVEPNDAPQSASPLSFPSPIAGEPVAANALGSVKAGGDLPRDAIDFFIFTPVRSGAYEIYLCNDPLVCTRGTVTEKWTLIVTDQNLDEIASTPRGKIVEQALRLQLEAGVPYYVGIDTFVSPSELNYNLTIFSDGN